MAIIVFPTAKASAVFLYTTILLVLLLAPRSQATRNIMMPGETLLSGQSLSIGKYSLTMQSDCNLVLYDQKQPIWDSKTAGKGTDCFLYLQMNGMLVITSNSADGIFWKSQERLESQSAFHGFVFVLQPDGNARVFGNAVWSTGSMNTSYP